MIQLDNEAAGALFGGERARHQAVRSLGDDPSRLRVRCPNLSLDRVALAGCGTRVGDRQQTGARDAHLTSQRGPPTRLHTPDGERKTERAPEWRRRGPRASLFGGASKRTGAFVSVMAGLTALDSVGIGLVTRP